MRRVAIITGGNRSSWTSCQSITRNLMAAYERAYAQATGGAEVRTFTVGPTAFDGDQLAEQITEWKPQVVAWTEHKPHPGAFLRAIAERSKDTPPIAVHVYGDFTLQSAEWLAIQDLLPKLKLRLICASEKQRRLVGQFTEPADAATLHVPFPVDSEVFSFSSARMRSAREALGVKPSEMVFLYTGRLSLQKNVTVLLGAFASYLQEVDPHAQLWLAGRPDGLGIPFLGVDVIEGWYPLQLQDLIHQRIPAERRHQVRYFGELGPTELRDLHLASSCYVSLSTHNDEDFGMAPAEALLCGSPLLLTDWGGFSSFQPVIPEHCSLVPVEIRTETVLPPAQSVLKAMVFRSLHTPAEEARERIARAGAEFCSIDAVAKRLASGLREIPEGAAQGWSSSFQALARSFRMGPGNPFRSTNGYSQSYRSIYRPYVGSL